MAIDKVASRAPCGCQLCNQSQWIALNDYSPKNIQLVGGDLDHDWILFLFSWEWKNHPNWRSHIFQRGRTTTNQPAIWKLIQLSLPCWSHGETGHPRPEVPEVPVLRPWSLLCFFIPSASEMKLCRGVLSVSPYLSGSMGLDPWDVFFLSQAREAVPKDGSYVWSGRRWSKFALKQPNLVGGLEYVQFLISHIIIGDNHFNWLIFFRGVGIPPTRNRRDSVCVSKGLPRGYFEDLFGILLMCQGW